MIVVAGEALIDLIVADDGSLSAIPGGGPYNTARAIGRLGMPVAWAGGLSADRFGRELEAGLVADGVALDLVQRTDLPTTLAIAELDPDGAATYRFHTCGTAAPALLAGPLVGHLPGGMRALHVGTLGLVLEPMATTIEALVAALPDDVLLAVDANCRPSIIDDPDGYRARLTRVLARADLVKVSGDDLAFLRPGSDAGATVAWIASLGPRAVLHTDGPATVRVRTGEAAHVVPVPPVAVVDTVGAGDTFGGALLASLVHEGRGRADLDTDAILRAARFGIRAAGVACTRAGANPPSIAELGGWPTA